MKLGAEMFEDTVDMMDLLRQLAPLPRTLASDATDAAYSIILEYLPRGCLHSFTCGENVWSWKVPMRWELNNGYIESECGVRIIDSTNSHLHVMNYSAPINSFVSREELFKHIYSSIKQPNAVPFVYDFYGMNWGFCIPHNWLDRFSYANYRVCIDSQYKSGVMNCITQTINGSSQSTYIIASNICHPCQVNDSLTGVAISVDIARRLMSRKSLKYTYIFMIVPETIGTVAYLANNPNLIECAIGAVFTEMLGTTGPLVGQKTRLGNTYWDGLYELVFKEVANDDHKVVDFLKSASNDEKVLDSPGVDIPAYSVTRYPYSEYHTSADSMDIINLEKLRSGRDVVQLVIDYAEDDFIPILKYPGPIFLSGYGLYPDWRNDENLKPYWESFLDVMYSIDGIKSVVEISINKSVPISHTFYWANKFYEKGLIDKIPYVIEPTKRNNLYNAL